MQADAMDAAALEALDPITHAHGLVTIGRGGEVALADSESQPGVIDTIREKQDMVTARASHPLVDAIQDQRLAWFFALGLANSNAARACRMQCERN